MDKEPLLKKVKLEGDNKNGPSVAIIAGVHGNELTPIYVLANMIHNEEFDVSNISSLTVINGINEEGIRQCTREIASSASSDLNRSFPTKKKGTEGYGTEKDYLKDVVNNHDVIIDVHASPSCTEFALIDIDEHANNVLEYCRRANVNVGLRYSGSDSLKSYALENGKMGITVETRGMDSVDRISHYNTIHLINRLLKNAKKRENEVYGDDYDWLIDRELYMVKTAYEGIISLNKNNGHYVEKNDVLCTINDLAFNKICDIKSPIKGQIICAPEEGFVNSGELLFMVQPTIWDTFEG